MYVRFEVFMAVTMKNVLFRVALVKPDVSEERIASIIRVTRIGELGLTLAVSSNRRTPQTNSNSISSQRSSVQEKVDVVMWTDSNVRGFLNTISGLSGAVSLSVCLFSA
jgi:hypothetical protein